MVLFLQCTARAAKRLGDQAAGPGGRAGRRGGRVVGRLGGQMIGRPSGRAAERLGCRAQASNDAYDRTMTEL